MALAFHLFCPSCSNHLLTECNVVWCRGQKCLDISNTHAKRMVGGESYISPRGALLLQCLLGTWRACLFVALDPQDLL